MAKKYVVRDGFVVDLEFTRDDKTKFTRTYQGGEEVTLEDDQAAPHQHKLEFASQKDRDAALEAEKKAAVAKAAAASPAELVQMLVAALQQAQAAAAPAPAPAA